MPQTRSRVVARNNGQQRHAKKQQIRKARLQKAKQQPTARNTRTRIQKRQRVAPSKAKSSKKAVVDEVMEKLDRLNIRNSLNTKPKTEDRSSGLWERRLRPRKVDSSQQQPLAIHTSAPWPFHDKQGTDSAGSGSMDLSTGRTPGSWSKRQVFSSSV